MECPSWLPAANAKTNAQIIVDRFAGHRDGTIHQENPLNEQSIWENCRPSQRGVVMNGGYAAREILDLEQEWSDTYALVCNSCVSIFTGQLEHLVDIPLQTISHLQKLCIVRLMHNDQDPFEDNHRDYVFTPTHSLHHELCMILQTRYFLLPHAVFTDTDAILCENVVQEISVDEYANLAMSKQHKIKFRVVAAQEIAFGPKGDTFANISIWFDAPILKLEQSSIKRSRRLKQKKKAQIRNEHTHPNSNGALISRTSSADFSFGLGGFDSSI